MMNIMMTDMPGSLTPGLVFCRICLPIFITPEASQEMQAMGSMITNSHRLIPVPQPLSLGLALPSLTSESAAFPSWASAAETSPTEAHAATGATVHNPLNG